MASETEVVWKCGSCDECFYDLQILASHKCIGNGTVALSESCIKQLQAQSVSFETEVADLNNSNDQVQVCFFTDSSYCKQKHMSFVF